MSLLPFFEWCEASLIGTAIRESIWLFPVIESLHLLALALIGGAVLIVDVRMFGWGIRRQSPHELARDVQPWLALGLAAMIVTGVLLFLSEAIKCYYSPAFWMKMAFLLGAIVYTVSIRPRVMAADDDGKGVARNRVAALLSVLLWSGVGIGGRAIGFY